MNITLIVEIKEAEGRDEIVVARAERTGPSRDVTTFPVPDINDAQQETIENMGALCEAILAMIHAADQAGIKPSHESMYDCINHLTEGFVDASVQATVTFNNKPYASR